MTPEELRHLRDPRRALRACGKVPAQSAKGGDNLIDYNPTTITVRMQTDILNYMADPPIDPNTGMVLWMLLIGGRQTGKSVTTEYAAYAKTAYSTAWRHLCTADTPGRAEELLKNVNSLHKTWPKSLRAERQYDSEVYQATFKEMHVGDEHLVERIMRTQHAGENPIGLPWDSWHWSEFCFSPEAGPYYSGLRPAIANRAHARVVWESTPNPGNIVPDVGFGREMYFAAKAARADNAEGALSRFFAKFYPFWDSKLCRRPWPKDLKPDLEELRLYERYHGLGLTWEHLAFRQETFRDDPEIRRDPELFGIWYPFDDLSCWAHIEGAIFNSHHLDRIEKSGRLVKWVPNGNAMYYRGYRKDPGEVDPDAGYLIAVDPNGYKGRDHGAATLREVWDDEQIQVASFAGGWRDGVNPESMAHWVGKTARRFKAVVLVEATGVGAGVLSVLRQQYPDVRLYCHEGDQDRPGVPATAPRKQEMIAVHKDALLSGLTLQDEDGFAQHKGYQNDKVVEETEGQLQLAGGKTSRNRRPRHHWDKVSAEMWASWGVANHVVRRPMKPKALPPPKDCWDTMDELDTILARAAERSSRGAFTPQGRT